jgi:glycosyltransferase involved in cell wall biosynthesis
VLIEALSAGLLPITTDQGGIPDLMRFHGAEVLVASKHESRQGIAETVRYLFENGSAYERLSGACLEHYRTHLTLQRCVDELLVVIEGECP